MTAHFAVHLIASLQNKEQTPLNHETDTPDRQLTPAMVQFYDIKKQYPDSILFFRMGDFYEMFDEDALTASKILGIALTSRNKNSKNAIPLCGIPYHSYLPYLVKLLKAGKKVAVCEQLEDAKLAKGVVKRGVTRVVTPATVVEDEALVGFDNNFLLSAYIELDTIYCAAVDVSTGETYLKLIKADVADNALLGLSVKEIISNADIEISGFETQVRKLPKTYPQALGKVLQHFDATSETALYIDKKGYIWALAMALDYLDDVILQTKLSRPVTLSDNDILILDNVAARTLELTENSYGNTENTLFSVLNHTCTQMGARAIKNAIIRPLRNIAQINKRLDAIEYLMNNTEYLSTIRGLLDNIYDIERITTRLLSGRAMPKDLVWLKLSLQNVPELAALLDSAGAPFAHLLMYAHADLYSLIDTAISDEPPANLKNGGIIKNGFNKIVDELRDVKLHSNDMLNALASREREKSGIAQLKIDYNKVFGFYFEISKSNLPKVPDHFERKQTLVNAERFVTLELKELENTILSADERLAKIEHELFLDIRLFAAERAMVLRELSQMIAEADMLASLAHSAIKCRYTRPLIDTSGKLLIKDGRHPVVEAKKRADFVPNDFDMDTADSRLMLITGPNMSGKSTYLRTAALIAIMAHMGSFVPASAAHIGVIDRIFTRVGASDNLSRGESTFMVEMVETANILTNATKNSLLILDEIGRGTSTFDGISIAWSVAEYILDKVGAKTLFATHYHELTEIADSGIGAKNYTVNVQEWQGEIIFLRKVVPGTADRSYGIYVGKLAGLPEVVTKRAEEILKDLENHEPVENKVAHKKSAKKTRIVQPILVFDDSHPVIDELKKINTDNLTPIQALQLLHELKEKAKL